MSKSKLIKAENIVIESLKEKTAEILQQWQRKEHIFKLKKDKIALIVVDMQNYYCNLGLETELHGLNEVIDNINKLVQLCHDLEIPVIWLRQNFTVDKKGSDAGFYEDLHKKPLTNQLCNLHKGTEIYKDLDIVFSLDHQVTKNRYSPFINNSSELPHLLKTLKRTQLIFCGVLLNVCVESSIRDAMQLNYEPILIADATTSVDRIVYEVSLLNIKLFFGDVYNTEDIIEKISIVFHR